MNAYDEAMAALMEAYAALGYRHIRKAYSRLEQQGWLSAS